MILVLLLLMQDAMHFVRMEDMARTPWTHVCTVGPVVYVRKQKDGDYHVTLDNGFAKLVVEIIPEIPIPPPKKFSVIKVCGISREDKFHKWMEIHPATSIEVVAP